MADKKYKGFRRRQLQSRSSPSTQVNRNSKRKKWSDDQMVGAIQAVINYGLSMNQAADNYQVPRSKDRLSGRVTHVINPGPKPYLTKDEEQGLTDYLISAASIGYGKARRDVLCLVEIYLRQKGSLKAL